MKTGKESMEQIRANHAELIRRLKSGEYSQAIGRLRDGPTCFCVSGLMLDIIDPTGWARRGDWYSWTHKRKIYGSIYSPDYDAVQDNFGFVSRDQIEDLINCNDDGMTFKHMAGYLVSHHNEYFSWELVENV